MDYEIDKERNCLFRSHKEPSEIAKKKTILIKPRQTNRKTKKKNYKYCDLFISCCSLDLERNAQRNSNFIKPGNRNDRDLRHFIECMKRAKNVIIIISSVNIHTC